MEFLSFLVSPMALDILLKLAIAFALSFVIGIERELIHKPAGIKTHTLICMSATLVMSLGIYVHNLFPETNVDPTRLPAQILAGIGFVGAGTILREGLSVKGLTTAASLLSITCIGLAVGAGFYEGAIYTTLLIFLTLCFVSPFQNLIASKGKLSVFTLISTKNRGVLSKAQEIFEDRNIDILDIKQIKSNTNKDIAIKFLVKCPAKKDKEELVQELCQIDGIIEVNTSAKFSKTDFE